MKASDLFIKALESEGVEYIAYGMTGQHGPRRVWARFR